MIMNCHRPIARRITDTTTYSNHQQNPLNGNSHSTNSQSFIPICEDIESTIHRNSSVSGYSSRTDDRKRLKLIRKDDEFRDQHTNDERASVKTISSDTSRFVEKSLDLINLDSIFISHQEAEKLDQYKYPVFRRDGVLQTQINPDMRRILINWLYGVAEEEAISSRTLCLAVHLLDNTIRLVPIESRHFQLWGAVCLLVAAKLEEVQVPHASSLVNLAGRCFSEKDVCFYERRLVTLVFQVNINITTRFQFAQYFAVVADLSKEDRSLYYYLTELSLADECLSQELSSKVAAAALCVTLETIGCNASEYGSHSTSLTPMSWNTQFTESTGYSERDLTDCVKRIKRQHSLNSRTETTTMDNIVRKFSKSQYCCTSKARRVAADPPCRSCGRVDCNLDCIQACVEVESEMDQLSQVSNSPTVDLASRDSKNPEENGIFSPEVNMITSHPLLSPFTKCAGFNIPTPFSIDETSRNTPAPTKSLSKRKQPIRSCRTARKL